MARLIAVVLCVLSTAALAQNTPSQTAIQIDNVINAWAQQIEAQQKQIADLQKQLEEAKAAQEKK
jgi:hypothetical protein